VSPDEPEGVGDGNEQDVEKGKSHSTSAYGVVKDIASGGWGEGGRWTPLLNVCKRGSTRTPLTRRVYFWHVFPPGKIKKRRRIKKGHLGEK